MNQAVKNEPISEENGAKQDSKGGRPDVKGQNIRRGRGGGSRGGGSFGARRDYVQDRLESMSGPSTNLQSREEEGKKFTGRCKLYVGNLPNNITEEDFRNMFTPFGETSEIFLNKQKGFGFVKLDTRQNAREAKAALDHSFRDGRTLRVKFANNDSALKIKNLSPWVSDELLEAAFGVFGEVERAVVIVDSRGNSVGEGIVEYSRKQSAELALRRCTEGCFILTSSPRPVLVEPLEQRDEEGGLPEKNFPKANDRYLKEREVGPRLVEPGAAEFEFCDRWKKLFALEQQKRDYLEKEIQEARRALDEQMEFYIYEHEARMLRERLHRMEEQSNFIQQELKLRREKDLQREEARLQQEMALRQQEEEILRRHTVDDMHRRQEDTLIMQEAALRQMQGGDGMPTGAMVSDHMAFPNGMMPGGGMGMSPHQSRFDHPSMDPAFSPGNNPMNNMGGPSMPSAGNMHTGHDMRHLPHAMQEEFHMDAKRRRY